MNAREFTFYSDRFLFVSSANGDSFVDLLGMIGMDPSGAEPACLTL